MELYIQWIYGIICIIPMYYNYYIYIHIKWYANDNRQQYHAMGEMLVWFEEKYTSNSGKILQHKIQWQFMLMEYFVPLNLA